MCSALVLALALVLAFMSEAARTAAMRQFSVADEIGLRSFDDLGSLGSPIIVSPDGRFVAIVSERGLVDRNRVEDGLRIYDMAKLREFVLDRRQSRAPDPVLDLHESTYEEGPIVTDVHWLPNSTGVVFLLRTVGGNYELVAMSLSLKRAQRLSLQGQDVSDFSVRDTHHYAYTVVSAVEAPHSPWRDGAIAWDVTGYPISMILSWRRWRAIERTRELAGDVERSVLWAAVGGEPRLVLDRAKAPIVLYPRVNASPVLSPDGHTLALAIPVARVPESWLHKFLPPYAHDPYDRMRHAGVQGLTSDAGFEITTEYAVINLRTGDIDAVNHTPTGASTAWAWTGALAGTLAWSADGRILLLPDAYQQPSEPGARETANRPCVAIFYLVSRKLQCLQAVTSLDSQPSGPEHGGPEPGAFVIKALGFAPGTSNKVVMRYIRYPSYEEATKDFVRGADDTWRAVHAVAEPGHGTHSFDVHIKEGLNERPTVVGRDTERQVSREIWDPNPQLRDIALGTASVFRWRDASGREWSGGLYRPPNYAAGRAAPLVIQTHGFFENRFRPSGLYTTAFAAQALAASGIYVLQVPNCPITQKPESAPCEVRAYDTAVRQLAAEKLIDPNRVGIVGFSYTVYTVLNALTTGTVHFAAASVTDGWSYGYWGYLTSVDTEQGVYSRVADEIVGNRPFGSGLQLWLRRAPDFNMQKVRAPLLVVSMGGGEGGDNLFGMWEPYAALRYLEKPVDLIRLENIPYEHVLTNPGLRMASQAGSVDWFRFWLQGEEVANVTSAAQYRLWEHLCDMQTKENPRHPTFCVHGERH